MPAIDYRYELTMTKGRTTYIYGSHDMFPWHEIYRSNNGGIWGYIYTYAPDNGGSDVWKLTSVWPNKNLSLIR